MKFTRFVKKSNIFYGVLTEDVIKEIKGDMFGEWEYTGQLFSKGEVKLLAPLKPNQIIGIGVNFVDKVENIPVILPEIPEFFFKPTSSVIGSEEEIVIPDGID